MPAQDTKSARTGMCPVTHSAFAAASAGCPVSGNAAAFDPFAPAYMQDPPEYVRWAREQQPVFYSPRIGYWVVTRYDDVKAVFRDHENFSPSIALEKITPTTEAANEVLASYNYGMARTLVNEDEPAHMARRRVLLEPFTPQALKHHEPMVRRLAREYVTRFIDDGRADLVDQMLWEVPLTIGLHFLGIDEEDMPLLRKYSVAHTVNTWGRPDESEQIKVAHAVGNFWQLAGKILEKMRRDPSGPGWMQFGIRLQADHPDVITDSYLHSMMMAGIVAAHETTANATINALKLLLQNPDVWKELCADPGLIPNAVEECLRFSGSIVAWRRQAKRDVNVAGVAIPAGAKLLLLTASGNHDDRHFPQADLLDIHRDNAADHLSFGYGAHQCMGKNLARMELQIFLGEFTRRLPHMKLAQQEFTYLSNTSFRGPEHLWVEWDPAQNPERRDPAILGGSQPVLIGDSARRGSGRPMRVESVRQVANDILQVRLATIDGRAASTWAPGAHIDVECGATGLWRQYSLCGDPQEANVLQVGVLRDTKSRGGSAWVHEHLREGQIIRIRGPRNHFHFDESARRVVLVAGGIGITPIAAMGRRARELGIDYVIHYSGRSRRTMAFLPELQQLHGERLQLHIEDEGGRADYATLLRRVEGGTQVYACGPERLLQQLERLSADWPQDTLRIEHFGGAPGKLDPSREQAFEVELKDSGLVLKVAPDRTLLETLRSANIDVQSDCGEGLCGSCEVRVLSGEVDHRDVVLTRAEREQNVKMMACCSRARCGRIVLEL